MLENQAISDSKSTSRKWDLASYGRNILPYFVLGVVIVFFQIVSKGSMINVRNLTAIFNEMFVIILGSSAMIFLMAQGKIDMSIAGIVAVSGAIGAYAAKLHPAMLLPVTLLTGLLIGCINGLIVNKLRIDSFVATLAVSFILTGLVQWILIDGVLAIPYELMPLDNTNLKAAVIVVIVVIGYILFQYGNFGKQSRAIGSRTEVARQSGVNINKITIISYMLTGATAGLVAFFNLCRSGSASMATGSHLQFNVMQALLLGGMALSGGSGSRFSSAILGSLTMAILSNGMTLWGIESLSQQLIRGVLFVITVSLTFNRDNIEIIK